MNNNAAYEHHSNGSHKFSNNGHDFSGQVDHRKSRNQPAGEGCVVLGLDGQADKQYVTRYKIDHKQQRQRLCCEALQDEWLPCCTEEAQESWKKRLWGGISSEAVLFTLHMGTIFLGVFKVSHPEVSESDHLEEIHSVIEMIVTCLLVVMRTAIGWVDYQEVKENVYKYEHVVDKTLAKGRHMKMWLVAYTAYSAFLVVLVVITFGVFYHFDHLGWTILVNQFTLVSIITTSGLFSARIHVTLKKLRDDQHKAIISESLLLMKEGYAATSAGDRAKYLARAEAFQEALVNDNMFGKPRHINVHETYSGSVADIDKIRFTTD